jgi:uncharacterized protein YlxP (DUF503 family)
MVVGLLRMEVFIPAAQSLKDKRSVVKRLRDQLRGRFNVAVAEVEPNDTWQRAVLGVSTIGEDRPYLEGLLREVAEWMRNDRMIELIRITEEYVRDADDEN